METENTLLKVSYSFLDIEGKKILVREFSEGASVDDVLASFEEVLAKKMLSEDTLGVITDLRQVKFEVNPFVFKKVSGFLKNNPELYKYKLAAITLMPVQVALVTIANTVSQKLSAKPFSSLGAAIQWVSE